MRLFRMQAQRVQRVTRRQRNVIGFRQIVVFRGQPENRNAIRRLSPSDNRGGLQQREEWPAEKSHLLPGNHCARSLAEALNVGQSLRTGSPSGILLAQQTSNFIPMGRVLRGNRRLPGI